MKSEGAQALQLRVDVVDPCSVASAVQGKLDRYGRIDTLINNAGINRDAISLKMTDERWTSVLDVSLRGTFNCYRATVPVMRRQMYGKIVNPSSISSLGNSGQVNYSAAKARVSVHPHCPKDSGFPRKQAAVAPPLL